MLRFFLCGGGTSTHDSVVLKRLWRMNANRQLAKERSPSQMGRSYESIRSALSGHRAGAANILPSVGCIDFAKFRRQRFRNAVMNSGRAHKRGLLPLSPAELELLSTADLLARREQLLACDESWNQSDLSKREVAAAADLILFKADTEWRQAIRAIACVIAKRDNRDLIRLAYEASQSPAPHSQQFVRPPPRNGAVNPPVRPVRAKERRPEN